MYKILSKMLQALIYITVDTYTVFTIHGALEGRTVIVNLQGNMKI
jgi:hypothetical protein